ncbi:MAG: hypothetical protein U5L11_00830 [Arhodomonas sp.]|nr:hypothetical protein [Arhodomonas sp.]
MPFAGEDLADHDAVEIRRRGLNGVHLQTSHGEPMLQLGGGGRQGHPFPQPLLTDPHRVPQ